MMPPLVNVPFSNTEVVPDKEIPVLDRVSVPPDNNVVPSGVVNDVSFFR